MSNGNELIVAFQRELCNVIELKKAIAQGVPREVAQSRIDAIRLRVNVAVKEHGGKQ